MASNGIHCNGVSLARRVFFELNQIKLSYKFSELESDFGTELIRPTYIYVKEALELIDRVATVKALMHITSDGFLNLNMVKAYLWYIIDRLPPVPPIFSIIQRLGHIDYAEMFSVYNMGVGFCAVVGAADADNAISILRSQGKSAFRIGKAISDSERYVKLPQYGLTGRGKHFWHE